MKDRIHDTILGIYDTVADADLWPDVLQNFAEQINAVGCIVFEWDNTPSQRKLRASIISSDYDPAVVETYISKCFDDEARNQDVFEAHSLAQDRIDLIEDDVLAPTVTDLKNLPNVRVLQKLGILHRAAGLLNKDNTTVSRFSVQLADTRGRLTTNERVHMAAILPHIAKALDLGRPAQQLAFEHQSMLAAMDRLTIGVCILDAKGRVVQTNEEFKRQQEAYPVFHTAHDDSLRLQKSQDQKSFETLKEHVSNHGRFGARPRKEAITTDGQNFLCIEVAPLDKSQEIGSKRFGGFILYSTDTSLPVHCNTLPLQRAYNLTDAELALVDMVAEGLTNAQIAERRNRSIATINTQVKSILSKTQCLTRTQFVRLMMSFSTDFVANTNKNLTT
jgi:DNA-binding CsgD family transcriptional regulator